MARDRDPIVRYGAMYAVAMAYCGTADNESIRKLLHVAVSDVSDDVRRAAVTCLGFLLFRTPEVPKKRLFQPPFLPPFWPFLGPCLLSILP